MLLAIGKRSVYALAFLVCALSEDLAARTPIITEVSFAAINLNWFGLNGSPNNPTGSEARGASIRQHLRGNNLLSDVMIFDEIVDIRQLETEVLNSEYQCHSYNRADPKHQHVVLCVAPGFRLDIAEGAQSYALESVDVTGRLRPAVHGVLKTEAGYRIAHVFGVHLKAMPEQSSVRLRQTTAIADYIEQSSLDDPVVIMGDFNTYANDAQSMGDVYRRTLLSELMFSEPYTWASGSGSYPPAKFDRVWISDKVQAEVSSHHVVGPCSSGDTQAISIYNRAVSDHCAVMFTITTVDAMD